MTLGIPKRELKVFVAIATLLGFLGESRKGS